MGRTNKGRIRYECISCSVRDAKPFMFMPDIREHDRARGVSCPKCGSRALERSKAGYEKVSRRRDAVADKIEAQKKKKGFGS